jgi:lysophospholipase L1-like esterase
LDCFTYNKIHDYHSTMIDRNINFWSFFIIIISLVACASMEDVAVIETMESDRDSSSTYTFLALGDSYTIGESVKEVERWPMILADRIEITGKEISKPKIIARTGWTTDELSKGIDAAGLKEKFDIVSLLIGVNNQYRGRDVENFRSEFTELLERAISFAYNKEKVFVVSIPDWGAMPFALGRDEAKIRREIDSYNQVVREESAKLNVKFIDITAISREAREDPVLVARDDLHPSGKMYQRWVDEKIYPAVEDILR